MLETGGIETQESYLGIHVWVGQGGLLQLSQIDLLLHSVTSLIGNLNNTNHKHSRRHRLQ